MKGFVAENWKLKLLRHPIEDAYSIDRENGIGAVADGVTRDPMVLLPDMGSFGGKLEFILRYPKKSPAREASRIFVETFQEVLRDYDLQNRGNNAVKNAFSEANRRIKDWNLEHIPQVDYVMKDFAGCVAAGVCKRRDSVSFGFLTDAGVAIFDSKGHLRFRTEDEGPNVCDKFFWQDEQLQGLNWRDPKARRVIRESYRNNPNRDHSYGVLTGEEQAMSYVRVGTQEFRDGDTLLVYTDGLEETIFSSEFSDLVRKGDFKDIEKLCRKSVRTEGTLVYCLNR